MIITVIRQTSGAWGVSDFEPQVMPGTMTKKHSACVQSRGKEDKGISSVAVHVGGDEGEKARGQRRVQETAFRGQGELKPSKPEVEQKRTENWEESQKRTHWRQGEATSTIHSNIHLTNNTHLPLCM